jgi:hypothetical protein
MKKNNISKKTKYNNNNNKRNIKINVLQTTAYWGGGV